MLAYAEDTSLASDSAARAAGGKVLVGQATEAMAWDLVLKAHSAPMVYGDVRMCCGVSPLTVQNGGR